MEFVTGRSWPLQQASAHFDSESFATTEAEVSPAQVRELLDEICKSSRRLRTALVQLQEMSARLSDGTAPLAGPHLSWLDEIIAQAMAGRPAADVSEEHLASIHFARGDFLGLLDNVEAAARYAQERAIRCRHRRGERDHRCARWSGSRARVPP